MFALGALQPRRALHAALVADRKACRLRQGHVGTHADPDDHEVAVELEPALRHHLRDTLAVALEVVDLLAAVDAHPVLLERVLEVAPHLIAVERLEGHVLQHHDRALHTVGSGERRRHLAADVAAADHHGAPPLLRVCLDRLGGAERAQVVDAVQVAAVDAQPLHVRAGGQQRRVELDLLLGGERRHASVGVELHHARPREDLDLLLVPPLVRAEQRVLARLLVLEIALRQRRPVVGPVRLAAHEQDRALAALLAEPASAVRGGQAAADDEMVDLARRHALGGRAGGEQLGHS